MNRLKQLRNELGYTVRNIEKITKINNVSVSFYENESRKLNADVLLIFANLYHVTTDYILCNSDIGIYVYYIDDTNRYILGENDFNRYLKEGLIFYKDRKRYIDLNKKMQLDNDINVALLLDIYERSSELKSFLIDKENCTITIPYKKYDVIEKIIKLDDTKFEAVKNMIKIL